ncbi:MAG TPA: helix-turn-helix transcriptional regulator [Tepidisphaeraceae bacterium]|nr:helix-turn-helix transcriptional regulator [Tepidisphaeraceae bacterium]
MQARRSNLVVAAAVRSRRQALKLSQEELAERCHLHRTYIGSVERGEGNITLDTLDKLAKALGVKPFELVRGESVR